MNFQMKQRRKIQTCHLILYIDIPDFEVTYPDDEIIMDEYEQPLININDNFNRPDDRTKTLVLEFVSHKIYDETIDLKCLI